MRLSAVLRLLLLSACLAATTGLRAWNYPGHRIVNQAALASLPGDFPDWIHTPENAERVAFLAGEPDRWRNTRVELLQHYNGLDHYIDIEEIGYAGLDIATLSQFRYDFAVQFSAGRAAHLDLFPPPDPEKDKAAGHPGNADHSLEYPGFLPWAIAEYYAKIQSAFSYLKAFEQAGTPEEIANARANIVYMMGVMGHYVGDGAQPLHTTIHHHGWVGPNPNGYSTQYGFHSWIDGGFIAKAGITEAEILPKVVTARTIDVRARPDGRDPIFVAAVDYLVGSNKLVEPLYRLEKEKKLEGPGPDSAEGRAFIDAQLLRGGEMLGSLWLTAWRQAAPDTYLRADLLKRQEKPAAR
ncbi:MAG: hypothetical protein ABSA05_07850 [Opitutaceae bacterium]|jgi:hypothetical protein